MEQVTEFFKDMAEFFSPIIRVFTQTHSIGEYDFTFLKIIIIIFSIFAVIVVANRFRNFLVNRILKRSKKIDIGLAESIGTMTKYFILVLGFIIIVSTSGINLSALGIVFGALGVGIGFGLQNITNNFISGLIILFERPIKVGDRIQVGDLDGDVVEIAARATTILTNDNISVIVPNSSFIDNEVINWSHTDRKVRFKFPVGVSYKEDPRFVRRLLMEVASENNGVMSKPPPDVLFEGFGDSSLNFELLVWTNSYTERPKILKSQLYYAIFKKFKDNHIEIPFPQRDLHIKTGLEWAHPIEPEVEEKPKKRY